MSNNTKFALFVMLAGLGGAALGAAGFALTGFVTDELAIKAVTGGLFAVLVPVVALLLAQSWLKPGRPG